jgi:hypothetical protein
MVRPALVLLLLTASSLASATLSDDSALVIGDFR